MKCPRCNTVNLNLAERQGVEIDYCPECRGVWLDRGELDKIIERSLSLSPSPAVFPQQGHPAEHRSHHETYRHHGERSHGYEGSGHHKRKSWLSELFD